MRPKKPKATEEGDLFRAKLDQIINMKHELVQLAGKVDWDWIDAQIAPLYSDKGRPGIETRFVVGLLLLKHIYGLSDEGVCDRWGHDPYSQHFTGEAFFQHEFPHERSDLSHWRKRFGEARSQAGHRGYHGAAQSRHLPDRRQAAACSHRRAQPAGPQSNCWITRPAQPTWTVTISAGGWPVGSD